MDVFLRNIDWGTFFLALGVFAFLWSIFNMAAAYFSATRAKAKVRKMEAELTALQNKLKNKDLELGNILSERRRK